MSERLVRGEYNRICGHAKHFQNMPQGHFDCHSKIFSIFSESGRRA
jgi:hypothetical protein